MLYIHENEILSWKVIVKLIYKCELRNCCCLENDCLHIQESRLFGVKCLCSCWMTYILSVNNETIFFCFLNKFCYQRKGRSSWKAPPLMYSSILLWIWSQYSPVNNGIILGFVLSPTLLYPNSVTPSSMSVIYLWIKAIFLKWDLFKKRVTLLDCKRIFVQNFLHMWWILLLFMRLVYRRWDWTHMRSDWNEHWKTCLVVSNQIILDGYCYQKSHKWLQRLCCVT